MNCLYWGKVEILSKKIFFFAFVIFFLLVSGEKIFAEVKKFNISDREITIEITYEEKDKKFQYDNFISILEKIFAEFKEVFGIDLPKNINFVIAEIDPRERGRVGYIKRGNIYIKWSLVSSISEEGIYTISHELGHLAIGSLEDSNLEESFVHLIGREITISLYKKFGKEIPKTTQKKICEISPLFKNYSYNEFPEFKLLDKCLDKYGHKVIGEIINDIKKYYLEKNKQVSVSYVMKKFDEYTNDKFFSYKYEKMRNSIIKDWGITIDEYGVYVKDTISLSEFREGDKIISIEGVKVNTISDFKKKLQEVSLKKPLWEKIKILVLRKGREEKEVLLELGSPLKLLNPEEVFEIRNRKKDLKLEKKGNIVIKYSQEIEKEYIERTLKIFSLAYKSLEEFEIPLPDKIYIIFEKKPDELPKIIVGGNWYQKFYFAISKETIEFENLSKPLEITCCFVTPHTYFFDTISGFWVPVFEEFDFWVGFKRYIISNWIISYLDKNLSENEKTNSIKIFKDINSPDLKWIASGYNEEKVKLATNIFYQIEKKYGKKAIVTILKNITKENWNEYLGCKDRFERKYITMQEFEEAVKNFTNNDEEIISLIKKFEENI